MEREHQPREEVLRDFVTRREPKPFTKGGFYFDVHRIPASGKVAKMVRMDRPERTRDPQAFAAHLAREQEFCAKQYPDFVVPAEVVFMPVPANSDMAEIAVVQEDLSGTTPVNEYLAGGARSEMRAELDAYLDALEATLDREGKIPESFDPLSPKGDVVVDTAGGRVILLDTNNILDVGTVDDYLEWRGRLASEPALRDRIVNRDRIVQKISAARAAIAMRKAS